MPHLGGQQEADEFAAEHPEGVRGRRLRCGRRGRRPLVAADILTAVVCRGARRGSRRAAQTVLHWDARQLQQDGQLSYKNAAI